MLRGIPIIAPISVTLHLIFTNLISRELVNELISPPTFTGLFYRLQIWRGNELRLSIWYQAKLDFMMSL